MSRINYFTIPILRSGLTSIGVWPTKRISFALHTALRSSRRGVNSSLAPLAEIVNVVISSLRESLFSDLYFRTALMIWIARSPAWFADSFCSEVSGSGHAVT